MMIRYVQYAEGIYKWEMRLRGIEPPHPAPEAGALSTELQTQTDPG